MINENQMEDDLTKLPLDRQSKVCRVFALFKELTSHERKLATEWFCKCCWEYIKDCNCNSRMIDDTVDYVN